MRLIDADALYEKLKEDEDLARQRVIDTPNSFPNGSLNPSAIRYMAQLSERTRFKEMIYDAPTIEPERKKDTQDMQADKISIAKEKILQCISELEENSKYHAAFIQRNAKFITEGLRMALDFMMEGEEHD